MRMRFPALVLVLVVLAEGAGRVGSEELLAESSGSKELGDGILSAEGMGDNEQGSEGLGTECQVLIFAGSDAGQSSVSSSLPPLLGPLILSTSSGKVWIMEDGVSGHWSQGSPITVLNDKP